MTEGFLRQTRVLIALCAVIATGLGLAYMSVAGAPVRYLAINAGALALGFCVVTVMLLSRSRPVPAAAVTLCISVILLATALFGVAAEGTTRWVSIAGLSIQPSLVLMPLMVLLFARARNLLSLAGIGIASLTLALQPDRAMAGALAAAMLALVAIKRERLVLAALVAAVLGFIVAMIRPDTHSAMPHVDQILFSSFNVHPLAGLAVAGGATVLAAPAMVGWLRDVDHRHLYLPAGMVWLVIVLAAALGNYPTPLVGYGGSAIIGYVLCMIGFDKAAVGRASDRAAADATHHDAGQQGFRLASQYRSEFPAGWV